VLEPRHEGAVNVIMRRIVLAATVLGASLLTVAGKVVVTGDQEEVEFLRQDGKTCSLKFDGNKLSASCPIEDSSGMEARLRALEAQVRNLIPYPPPSPPPPSLSPPPPPPAAAPTAVGVQVRMGMYGDSNTLSLGSTFSHCTPSDVYCDTSKVSCSGSGTTMSITKTAGNGLGGRLMRRNYVCGAGNLPTSFIGSMSGNGVHYYRPTFATIAADGTEIKSISWSCSPAMPQYVYTSWNEALSCTLTY